MDDVVELELAPTPEAGAKARCALAALRLFGDEAFAVRLLMTELINNSVRHAGLGAGDRVRVRVDARADRLRVEVRDDGTGGLPALRPVDATGGWGLRLVDALALRWDGGRAGDTCVWFELTRGALRVPDRPILA